MPHKTRFASYFYLLLAILVFLDAWLMAHPNTLGKFGIWLYKYDYLRTFPKALATIGLSTLCLAVVSELVWRFLPATFAKIIYILLLILFVFTCIQTIQQFSSGIYAHTGSSFRLGAMLLPAIHLLVLGYGLWMAIRKKNISQ